MRELKLGTLLTDGDAVLRIVGGLEDRIDYVGRRKIHYKGYAGKVMKWDVHPERIGHIETFGEVMIETGILKLI